MTALPSPRRRAFLQRALLAGAALIAAPLPSAAAVTTSHRLQLQSDVGSLAVRPSGSIHVLSTRRTERRLRISVSALRRDGVRDVGRRLVSARTSTVRGSAVVFTADGAVAALERSAAPGRRRSIDVVTLRGDERTGPQRISTDAGSASEPEAFIGGHAVGVMFTQRPPRGARQFMWAYRPAGAERFRRAVPLTEPGHYLRYRQVVALGAGGTGAFLETSILPSGDDPPAYRLRRLNANGSVGPWITVSDEGFEDGVGKLAVAPDGTIVIAFWADRVIDGRRETALVATTLPPDASKVTPPQRLITLPGDATGSSPLTDFTFALSTGPSGQTALATVPDDAERLKVFTGPATRLALTGDFRVAGIEPPKVVTVTRDGGVTAAWTPNDTFAAQPIFAAHQPPGGRFSTPSIVARTAFRGNYAELSPASLFPTRGGKAVLHYIDSNGAQDRFTPHVVTLSP